MRSLVRGLGACVLASSCLAAVKTAAPLDASTMVEKSVAANEVDYKASPDFDHQEIDRTRTGNRTYQVTMIDGSPYRRLIAINRHPLSASQTAEEQTKQQQAIAQRKAESPAERQARIAKYQKDRSADHAMMNQLTKAFDFQLIGPRRLKSFDTWLLKATPRPGYNPPNMETQALRGMRGELWLDQKTYQWVKVTAQVVRPVSIESFLARVEPGTQFELDKAPVNASAWLVTHFSAKSRANILFIIPHSSWEDDTYFDYTPVGSAGGSAPAGTK